MTYLINIIVVGDLFYNTNIYISSGLGTRKYHYRFNNKPSFNLYRLKAQK